MEHVKKVLRAPKMDKLTIRLFHSLWSIKFWQARL